MKMSTTFKTLCFRSQLFSIIIHISNKGSDLINHEILLKDSRTTDFLTTHLNVE